MVKKYGPEPEPEDDAADAAATDEEDDEHPRVAPGKNADGADDDEELAQPAPEEPFVRGVRCFFFDAARRWRDASMACRVDGVKLARVAATARNATTRAGNPTARTRSRSTAP